MGFEAEAASLAIKQCGPSSLTAERCVAWLLATSAEYEPHSGPGGVFDTANGGGEQGRAQYM